MKGRYGSNYNRSLVLVLAWCGIKILIRSFENSRKMSKRIKIILSPYLSVSLCHQWTCKLKFELCRGNYGILPLLCESKSYKIGNFKCSENLKPNTSFIESDHFQLVTYPFLHIRTRQTAVPFSHIKISIEFSSIDWLICCFIAQSTY